MFVRACVGPPVWRERVRAYVRLRGPAWETIRACCRDGPSAGTAPGDALTGQCARGQYGRRSHSLDKLGIRFDAN